MSSRQPTAPRIRLDAVLAFAAPYRAELSLVVVLMIVDAAVALAVPWLGGRFAGGVAAAGGAGAASLLAPLLGVLAALALLRFTRDYLSGRTGERMLADLTCRVYDHVQSLPLAFFHRHRRGDVLSLIALEVPRLSEFISRTLPGAVPRLLTAAAAAAMMCWIDPLLAGLIVVVVPLYVLLFKTIGRRLRPMSAELQRRRAEALAIAEENVELLQLIKTFAAEPRESARHRAQVMRVAELATAQHRIESALEPATQFLAAAAAVVLLWLAGSRMATAAHSVGDVVSLLLYAALLAAPISALASLYGQLQAISGVLARLQGVLDETPEPTSAPVLAPRAPVAGRIEYRGVGFSYPGRAPVLSGLDLAIAAGETVAVTGANGAGKSTLVHLLLRLMQPARGAILIDGRDISTLPLPVLRGGIAIVSQRVQLFNASVAMNIAYGCPEAGAAAIAEAARRAQAHDFIARLPNGYDTLIGDDGVRLSGGQRQRIALARAILKEAPIVILDEATAMFDPEGERDFIADSRAVLAGRTMILITHRPAALALADRVVAIHDGKAVEVKALSAWRAAE